MFHEAPYKGESEISRLEYCRTGSLLTMTYCHKTASPKFTRYNLHYDQTVLDWFGITRKRP